MYYVSFPGVDIMVLSASDRLNYAALYLYDD